VTYFVSRGGQEWGPYSLAQLQQYVTEGRIAPSDLVRTEGVEQWATVSEVIGNIAAAPPPTNYGSVPVYGTPAAPGSAAPGDLPPGLHWALVLLLAVVTCGVFGWIWMFVQAAYMKKQRPGNTVIVLYAIGLAVVIFGALGAGVLEAAHSDGATGFQLLEFGGAITILVGHFKLRDAIEEAFNVQLSGAMTFFFNVVYFQYHLSRIRQYQLTGVWS
jgi:hypothetical protein